MPAELNLKKSGHPIDYLQKTKKFCFFRSMNGTLPRPDLHLPLPNSETDPDSWSCSRSRDTSPDSSIPPGMPSFRVIPLTCESEAGSADLLHDNQYVQRGSEPPVDHWEIEPLRSGSAQPPSTLLRKNQYWVRKFTFSQNSHFFFQNSHFFKIGMTKGTGGESLFAANGRTNSIWKPTTSSNPNANY